jgi:tryptophan-rich sensory protein
MPDFKTVSFVFFVWRDLLHVCFFLSLQRVYAAIQIAIQDFANQLMQFNFSLALTVVHFLVVLRSTRPLFAASHGSHRRRSHRQNHNRKTTASSKKKTSDGKG